MKRIWILECCPTHWVNRIKYFSTVCIRKRIEYPQIIIEYFSEYYLRTTYIRTCLHIGSGRAHHFSMPHKIQSSPSIHPSPGSRVTMLSIDARVTADQEWEGAQRQVGMWEVELKGLRKWWQTKPKTQLSHRFLRLPTWVHRFTTQQQKSTCNESEEKRKRKVSSWCEGK